MNLLFERVFSGQYSFERRISSPQLSFKGSSIFEKGSLNQILYREEGQYSIEGGEQLCYQKRIFIIDVTNLYICKTDNSVLHEFAIDNVRSFPIQLDHTHHCKEDRYLLAIDIYSDDRFSWLYLIKGPSKDYKIKTDFIRSGT